MKEKIIGILGGMGPEATCEVFRRIIKLTDATSDKDHIRVIIDSNSKIPDRTKAILDKGESPVDKMVETAKNLEGAGADFIIMPCMTAHYFIGEVQQSIQIPIIDALKATKNHIDQSYPSIEKIGLLATTGTIEMKLFQNAIKHKQLILPNKKLQEEMVMDAIYGEDGIKSGNTSPFVIDKLVKVIEIMKKEGAEAIIAGCTELGLVLASGYRNISIIDPLTILAEESIRIVKETNVQTMID